MRRAPSPTYSASGPPRPRRSSTDRPVLQASKTSQPRPRRLRASEPHSEPRRERASRRVSERANERASWRASEEAGRSAARLEGGRRPQQSQLRAVVSTIQSLWGQTGPFSPI
eukprot:3465580-Prymnesium_polylepis.1